MILIRNLLRVKYLFGLFKIFGAIYLFVINWKLFFRFISKLNEDDSATNLGNSLSFFLLLLYCFYLFYSGLIDLGKVSIIDKKFVWAGILIGGLIAVALFSFESLYYTIFGLIFLLISLIELGRLIKKKR